ncbi:MAG: hypothetical protein JWQ87_3377 [Candidatus Sulfotelmatobacter sp.]|nr:hypothetical protein [Candidatus Sulfotelmatobacter sp.]
MFHEEQLGKVFPPIVDLFHMLNPVSSVHTSQASQTTKPAAPKAQPQQQSPPPSDKVTLKSTGDANHDGDSK